MLPAKAASAIPRPSSPPGQSSPSPPACPRPKIAQPLPLPAPTSRPRQSRADSATTTTTCPPAPLPRPPETNAAKHCFLLYRDPSQTWLLHSSQCSAKTFARGLSTENCVSFFLISPYISRETPSANSPPSERRYKRCKDYRDASPHNSGDNPRPDKTPAAPPPASQSYGDKLWPGRAAQCT